MCSGSWFLISYTTYFMVVSGLTVNEAFKYSLMKSCLGFVGVNLGIYLMRHVVGRRTIMMMGSATQGLCMLVVAITATTSAGTLVARNCLIAFTALYMFAYNAFVGAASYPVATELVSTRLRSWTVGSAISLGYFLAWLTGFCSPYFINPENMNWVCFGFLFLLFALWQDRRELTAGAGSQVRVHLGRIQLCLRHLLLCISP